MVTGLQLPLQALPLDGTLGKPQPTDSESIEPVSFGEILKLKEKQLQHEQQVSAASVAAALMALQSQIVSLPSFIPNIDVSETQTSGDGTAPTAAPATGVSLSSLSAQPATARLTSTESSAPVIAAFSSIAAMSAAQPAALPESQAVQTAGSLSSPTTTSAKVDAGNDSAKTPAANVSATVDKSLTDRLTTSPANTQQSVAQSQSVDVPATDNVRVRVSTARVTTVPVHNSAPVVDQRTATVESERQSSIAPSVTQSTDTYQAAPTRTSKNTPSSETTTVKTRSMPEAVVQPAEVASTSTIADAAKLAVSQADNSQPAINTSSAVPDRSAVTAPIATELPQSEQVAKPANTKPELKTETLDQPVSEFHAAQPAIRSDVRVQSESQQQPVDRVYAETEMSQPVQRESVQPSESKVVETTGPLTGHVLPDVERPVTVRTIHAPEVAAQNDEVAPADVSVSQEMIAPEKANAEAMPTAVTTPEVPSTSVRVQSPVRTPDPVANDETQTVNAMMSDDVPAMTPSAKTDGQPVVFDRELKTEHPLDEPVATPTVRAETVQHDAQMPAANTRTVEKPSPELPAAPEDVLPENKPADHVRSVATPKVSFENKETVKPQPAMTSAAPEIHVAAQVESVPGQAKSTNDETPVAQERPVDVKAAVVENDAPVLQSDKAQNVEAPAHETVDTSRSDVHPESVGVQQQPLETKPVAHSDVRQLQPVSVTAAEPKVQEQPVESNNIPAPVAQAKADAVDVKTENVAKPVEQVVTKEEIQAGSKTSSEEETRPAEKPTETNQTPASTVSTSGVVNDAKVGELNGKMPVAQANIQATEVVQQVIRQMNGRIKPGTTSMRLQLNPKELGAIEVDMVSGPQGVHVTFFAEQASTGRLLETQLNQLRDSLVDSGVQLSGLNIGQHNTQGHKGGAFSQEPSAAPWPNEIFVEESRAGVTETSTAERRFGRSSEVDYRV